MNKFSLPWRYDTYKASLGHTVNRVVSFNGEQIFQGSKEDCNLIVAASSATGEEIKKEIESKWAGALESCNNRAESTRKRLLEEISSLTQQCYSYQNKIKDLGGNPFGG